MVNATTRDVKNAIENLASSHLRQGYSLTGIYRYSENYYRFRLEHQDPKNAKIIRPLSKNGHGWALKEPEFPSGKKPLYRLQDVQANHGATVWVVEGERCADALTGLGLVAVTSGSSSSADSADWGPLKGHHIILWPDNDQPGQRYADAVEGHLIELGCSVERTDVQLLNLPEAGDCVDWLAMNPGSTKADVENLRLFDPPAPATEAHEWEAPVLFDEIGTPDIPASLLPGVFGEFASALAEETETPECLSVMTSLGVISTCAAKKFVVSPRQGWREPVNIYILTGFPPANNKSLVLKRHTKPFVEWESYQEEILGPEIVRQQSERKTREKIIEKLRTSAANADPSKQSDLIKEIADKEVALSELRSLFLPRLFLTDSTLEALGLSVHEQNGRFSIFTDEGGILEVVSGLYSNGVANVDLLLKGIDGGFTRIRRMSRYVEINPYLTLVIVAQPAIIQGMGEKRAFAGNGMIERFLYVLPKSKLGYRTHTTKPVAQHIADAYNLRVTDLLNIPALKKDDVECPYILTLAAKAYSDWREFQGLIEVDLKPNGRLSPCLGWGGKISGYALRIAGLIHVAEHGHCNLVISQETMERALDISTLLIEHALAAFGLMGVDQATSDAKELYQWVISQGKAEFTQRDITFAMRNRKMGKIDRLYPAIEILLERHILTMERLPTKKPTTNYQVNPALVKE